MGVMAYGGIRQERFELTEATCVSGAPSQNDNPPEGPEYLPLIREALFKGDFTAANHMTEAHLAGRKGNYGTNLPFGNLKLDFHSGHQGPWSRKNDEDSDFPVEGYLRQLTMADACSHVQFRHAAVLPKREQADEACSAPRVTHTREAFVSHPAKVLVVRISATEGHLLDFSISLDGARNPHRIRQEGTADLVLSGEAREIVHSDGLTGVSLSARLRILPGDGTVKSSERGCLRVSGTSSVVLLLAVSTDFNGSDPAETCLSRIEKASLKSFADLMEEHRSDYAPRFLRSVLVLGKHDARREKDLSSIGATSLTGRGTGDLSSTGADTVAKSVRTILPAIDTNALLACVKEGGIDPVLSALLYNYGRYLLLSASREDSALPAHLQGVWNDDVACRMGWTCDMHLDINTEMNYWPSETTGLPECAEPLFRWIRDVLVPSGIHTAKTLYGLEGWVAHVVSNAWGFSAPGWSAGWGFHPTGGVWAAMQMWERWTYGGDPLFLRETVLPVFREACHFFTEYLVPDPATGWLLSGPSMSPENCIASEWDTPTTSNLVMGPVCDTVLVRELFTDFLSLCDTLALDEPIAEVVKGKLRLLPPFSIGRHGQLQEWFVDYDEPDPHHRHTAHLLSVFPFAQVTPEETPELARAARISTHRRFHPSWLWEDTGWARSLLILYAARLGDAEEAHAHLLDMQRILTSPNLLTYCLPGAGSDSNVFEMDGSTGCTTAIAEMLLHSHRGEIHLLPALPKAWPEGRMTGLRTRGGFIVDMIWRDGELASASIQATREGAAAVRYGEHRRYLRMGSGETITLRGDLANTVEA